MKIHIKTILPILILMGGTMLFSNCRPDEPGCEEKNTYKDYSISQNTLNQIPYRKDGLDTLVYISTVGDTAILYGNGIKKRYVQNKEDEDFSPDCNNYTNYKIQVIDYSYSGRQSDFNRLTFYLYHYVFSKEDAYEVANYTSKLPYKVAFLEITKGSGDYKVNIINNEQNFNDSIIVDNVPIYGIKMYSKTDGIIAVYNKKYGILKVETGGKTWIKKF